MLFDSIRKRSVQSISALAFAGITVLGISASQPVQASEPFIAEIKMFGGNFAPRGFALCDGQLLPIAQNTALFALLGTTYGGDGRTTFALPDLRGRVAIHPGTGPGLSTYRLGQKGGAERVALTTSQMPAHSHGATLNADSNLGDSADPSGNILAEKRRTNIYSTDIPNVTMSSDAITVANTGGGQAHENRMPFLGINHIIALQGLFPSRN